MDSSGVVTAVKPLERMLCLDDTVSNSLLNSLLSF